MRRERDRRPSRTRRHRHGHPGDSRRAAVEDTVEREDGAVERGIARQCQAVGQPARARAREPEVRGVRIAVRAEPARARREIVARYRLGFQARRPVPRFALVAAAAHGRAREDAAALEPGEQRRPELRAADIAEGAVRAQDRWRRPARPQPAPQQDLQRHRDARVAGRRVDANRDDVLEARGRAAEATGSPSAAPVAGSSASHVPGARSVSLPSTSGPPAGSAASSLTRANGGTGSCARCAPPGPKSRAEPSPRATSRVAKPPCTATIPTTASGPGGTKTRPVAAVSVPSTATTSPRGSRPFVTSASVPPT